MSPEQAIKIIEASAQSSKIGDLIVVHTMDCSLNNINENIGKGKWKKVLTDNGIEAFQQDYEFSLVDLERIARSKIGFSNDWQFKLDSFDTDVEKSTKVIQNLTFYTRNALMKLLENGGFSIESVRLTTNQDNMQRLMILARKK